MVRVDSKTLYNYSESVIILSPIIPEGSADRCGNVSELIKCPLRSLMFGKRSFYRDRFHQAFRFKRLILRRCSSTLVVFTVYRSKVR